MQGIVTDLLCAVYAIPEVFEGVRMVAHGAGRGGVGALPRRSNSEFNDRLGGEERAEQGPGLTSASRTLAVIIQEQAKAEPRVGSAGCARRRRLGHRGKRKRDVPLSYSD